MLKKWYYSIMEKAWLFFTVYEMMINGLCLYFHNLFFFWFGHLHKNILYFVVWLIGDMIWECDRLSLGSIVNISRRRKPWNIKSRILICINLEFVVWVCALITTIPHKSFHFTGICFKSTIDLTLESAFSIERTDNWLVKYDKIRKTKQLYNEKAILFCFTITVRLKNESFVYIVWWRIFVKVS